MGDSDPDSGRLTARSRQRRRSVRCFESGYTTDRVAYPRDTSTAAVDKHEPAQALASFELLPESDECGAPPGQKGHHHRTGPFLCKPLWARHSHHAEPTPAAVLRSVGVPEEDGVASMPTLSAPKPVLSNRYTCVPLAQPFSTPDHYGRCRAER